MSLFSSPFDPSREAAIVTGAGNGIGRAIAQALVGEGVRTVFADISKERVAAAINAASSSPLATDVTRQATITAATRKRTCFTRFSSPRSTSLAGGCRVIAGVIGGDLITSPLQSLADGGADPA